MKSKRGFTLIELLIVIVIIGITISFAMLAFGDFGQEKRILFAAEQLRSSLRLAQQQAILQSTTLGLRIDNSSYQIVKFNGTDWTSSNIGIYKTVKLPTSTIIRLRTESQTNHKGPAIIIDPSGEITPFSIIFDSEARPGVAQLSANRAGSLTFDKLVKRE